MSRILVDQREITIGGAERNLDNLRKILSCKAQVISLRPDCIEVSEGKLIEKKLYLKENLKIFYLCYYLVFCDIIVAGKNNFTLLTLGWLLRKKRIIRVNNSFEAYLYWSSLKSFVSYVARFFVSSRDYILVNSEKNRDFYLELLRTSKNMPQVDYFPNISWLQKTGERDLTKTTMIYLSGRLAEEKRLLPLMNMLQNLELEYTLFTDQKKGWLQNPNISEYKEIYFAKPGLLISNALFEGMPNAVLDALSAGHTVLLSNNWAHVELYLLAQNICETQSAVRLFNTLEELNDRLLEKYLSEIDPAKNIHVFEKMRNMQSDLRNTVIEKLWSFTAC